MSGLELGTVRPLSPSPSLPIMQSLIGRRFPGTGPNIHRHCQIVMGVFQITLEVKLSPLSWP